MINAVKKFPKDLRREIRRFHVDTGQEIQIAEQAALVIDFNVERLDLDNEEGFDNLMRLGIAALHIAERADEWGLPELKSREQWDLDPKVEVMSIWAQQWKDEPDLE